jgi:hypothetical protein
VVTGKIATSLSNISLAAVCSERVNSSLPYDGTEPAFAALMAAMMASQAGVTLSLVKFRLNVIAQS